MLGPLLLAHAAAPKRHMLGVADALAAGVMLGIGYPLMSAALTRTAPGATLGAVIGIFATYLMHRELGVGGVPGSGEKWFAAAAVHAVPEGIALGAAAAFDPRNAIVLAAALALHNISESAVLAEHIDGRASARVRASALGVLSNAPQVVLAVASLALAGWVPALLSPLLGAAFGGLTYLCFAELLPESYRFTGRTSIAVVVTVAAGVVALLSGRAG